MFLWLGKRYEEHIMRIETCKEFKSRIEQDNIAIGLTSRKHDLPWYPSIIWYKNHRPQESKNHMIGFTNAAKTEFAHEFFWFTKQVKDTFDDGLHWKGLM